MNFGDILDEWDKETAKPYGKKRIKKDEAAESAVIRRDDDESDADGKTLAGASASRKASAKELPRANPMDIWLRRYGVEDKDSASALETPQETPAARRQRLRAMKPEAVIDLHGLTRDEAWMRLTSFFTDCLRQRLQKVLIIHGKGTHSADDPVLRGVVKLYIEQNPHAGESGHSEKDAGGSGSTWVILK